MKVLITGGCGFLGQMIAKAILARGELRGPDGNVAEVDSIQLFDQLAPVTPFDWADSRVTTAAGDISDKETVSALVDRDDISVFHLASVVSAGSSAEPPKNPKLPKNPKFQRNFPKNNHGYFSKEMMYIFISPFQADTSIYMMGLSA